MADPALGSKQLCPNCQAKFYDLNKRPAHCPKCETEFDPEEAVKFRRIRARSTVPDYETDEEAEDKVKASAKGGEDEDEDEDVGAPEIDEAAEDDVLPADEDEDEGAAPDAGAGEADEDVDLEEEDDAVPFLEEDEDGFEEEIEGLPEEGEDDEH